MDTFDRLRQSKGLTNNERAIVAYILENPEETARISSRELARRTYTSATAVLRLSKKLGFENYNALKVNIVSDLKRAPLGDVDIRKGDNALAVLGKVAELEQTVIARMREDVSAAELKAVTGLVNASRYVDFLGVDANAALGAYACHLLVTTGCIATPVSNMDHMIYLSLNAPRDHVAFLVSRSGTDKTLVEAAKNLRACGVETVALTADGSSPLSLACSHRFVLAYHEVEGNLANIAFYTAGKYLIDTLYAQLVSDSFDEVARLIDHYGALYTNELDRGGVRATR